MKTLRITGDNYFGHWEHSGTACRGIVIRDGMLLLSYETKTNQWMIPGGGLEDGEDETACCNREVAEETGVLIRPSSCVLEIDEYYEDWRYVSRYFFGEVGDKLLRDPSDGQGTGGWDGAPMASRQRSCRDLLKARILGGYG